MVGSRVKIISKSSQFSNKSGKVIAVTRDTDKLVVNIEGTEFCTFLDLSEVELIEE
jgi:transcription antitermination factor NusG